MTNYTAEQVRELRELINCSIKAGSLKPDSRVLLIEQVELFISSIRERESAPAVPVVELESLAVSFEKFVPGASPGPLFGAGQSHAYAYAAASIRQLIARHEGKEVGNE